MRKSTLTWIIVLMSVALVGLISFQLQWINVALQANEERFEKDVLESLQKVALRLEEQEVVYTVYNQLHSFPPDNELIVVPDPGSPQVIVFNDDSILGRNTIEFQFNISDSNQAFSFNSQFFSGSAMHEQRESIEQLKKEKYLMQKKLERLNNKSDLVADVVYELLTENRSITNRFNPVVLDSLLDLEFREKGIGIPFEFGVISPGQNRFVALKNAGSEERLLQSPLRATLFPNDIFGDQAFLIVSFQNKARYLLGKLWFTLVSSGILAIIISFCFGYAVYTIVRQKKVSEMKNDFINNMTHEFKTPIATVGLAVEALQDHDIASNPKFHDRYLKVIDEENKRLAQQVEKVLHMATLDKQELKMKSENLNMNDLIQSAIDNMSIQIESKSGQVNAVYNAEMDNIIGDEGHMTNVVINLLENALKYSKEDPVISLRTENKRNQFVFSIQDRGQGMSRESIRHIFQKFYRIPKGNLHDVRGFGLGLAYVKTIIDLHHGEIYAESEIGKGSKFTIAITLSNGKA